MVAHAYKMFCDSAKVSALPDGYHVQNRELADGSKVRMESNKGVHRVMVWPVGGADVGEEKIPHGIAVRTNWSEPTFLHKKDGDWTVGVTPPQLKKAPTYSAYNHSTYIDDDGGMLFAPFFYREGPTALWLYDKRKALIVSDMPSHPPRDDGRHHVLPISLSYPEKLFTLRPHYVVDNWIVNLAGQLLAQAPELPRITALGEETHDKLPATVDGMATQVCLTQTRLVEISHSAQIYKFRHGWDLFSRTEKDVYQLVDSSYSDITSNLELALPGSSKQDWRIIFVETPFYCSHTVAGSANWTIGYWSPPPNPVFYPDAVSGTDVFHGWLWTGNLVTNVTDDGDGGKDTWSGENPGGAVDAGTFPVPNFYGFGVARVKNSLYFPIRTEQTTALRQKRAPDYVSSVPGGVVGYGLVSDFVNEATMDYTGDSSPYLSIELDWTELKLLEGHLKCHYFGKRFRRTRGIRNSYEGWGDNPDTLYTTVTIPASPDISDGDGPYLSTGRSLWNQCADNAVDFASLKALYPHGGDVVDDFTPPVNSVDYKYTSRHILDVDNRLRFCAMLRVEVDCSGGTWKQNPDGYMGQTIPDHDAAYNIKIFFEIRHDQKIFESLLFEEDGIPRELGEATFSWFQDFYNAPGMVNPEAICYFYKPPKLSPGFSLFSAITKFSYHQGVNPNLAGSDYGLSSVITPNEDSLDELEYSRSRGAQVFPHRKIPQGIAYRRKFRLAALNAALWMMYDLKLDAPLDFSYLNPKSDYWYYFPKFKTELESQKFITIEFLDGKLTTWTDLFENPPDPQDRDTEVYFV